MSLQYAVIHQSNVLLRECTVISVQQVKFNTYSTHVIHCIHEVILLQFALIITYRKKKKTVKFLKLIVIT